MVIVKGSSLRSRPAPSRSLESWVKAERGKARRSPRNCTHQESLIQPASSGCFLAWSGTPSSDQSLSVPTLRPVPLLPSAVFEVVDTSMLPLPCSCFRARALLHPVDAPLPDRPEAFTASAATLPLPSSESTSTSLPPSCCPPPSVVCACACACFSARYSPPFDQFHRKPRDCEHRILLRVLLSGGWTHRVGGPLVRSCGV